MIAIKPYFDDVIDSLSEINLSKKRNKTRENPNGDSWFQLLMTQQHQHKVESKLYAAKDVKAKLVQIFHNKCAFCERDRGNAPQDIEHFRPKNHYYWLCYEWTNLLLSCPDCNRDYKKVQFPLEKEANRVKNHPIKPNHGFDKANCHLLAPVLQHENPILLHPALDAPKEHLRFLKDGSLEALTERGQQSIEVYGLNRDDLILKRQGIIRSIQAKIWSEYKYNPLPTQERIARELFKILDELSEQIADNQSFTAFRIAILDHFESFIINNETILGELLPNRAIMSMAFNNYMS